MIILFPIHVIYQSLLSDTCNTFESKRSSFKKLPQILLSNTCNISKEEEIEDYFDYSDYIIEIIEAKHSLQVAAN